MIKIKNNKAKIIIEPLPVYDPMAYEYFDFLQSLSNDTLCTIWSNCEFDYEMTYRSVYNDTKKNREVENWRQSTRHCMKAIEFITESKLCLIGRF